MYGSFKWDFGVFIHFSGQRGGSKRVQCRSMPRKPIDLLRHRSCHVTTTTTTRSLPSPPGDQSALPSGPGPHHKDPDHSSSVQVAHCWCCCCCCFSYLFVATSTPSAQREGQDLRLKAHWYPNQTTLLLKAPCLWTSNFTIYGKETQLLLENPM